MDQIGPFRWEHHPARLPVLQGGREPGSRPVVIVGGGPVGLAVALALARHGVGSVVLEADDSVCEGSRAACISRRSLEILERLGVVSRFLEKGLHWTNGRSFYRDKEVYRFSMPHDERQKNPPMINLQQYYIEQFLLEEIRQSFSSDPEAGGVDVRWQSNVVALQRLEDGCELTVETPLGGYSMQARWVVACDGGQSFVRRSLDLPMIGTAYTGRYVIIDIELPSGHPTERRAWFDPPWWPGSTILMHRQPDDIWRIDYQLRHGDDTEAALQPDAAKAFVQRHLDAIGEGHLPWKLVWTSLYRAGAMTIASYRHGPILFAGNAAHAMPIFGVRGLNSGFDDADNLSWKLARVVRGESDVALLDTYSDERIEAFRVNASYAMRSTEFMSPPSRGFDLLREAALSLAESRRDIANLINPRQTQAVSYSSSLLSTPDGDEAFECGPAPGAPLIDIQLSPDRRGSITDLVRSCDFTVLVFGKQAASTVEALAPALERAPVAARVVAVDADAAVEQTYGTREGAVYLVRPDGHVAARWRQPRTHDVLAALERAAMADLSAQRSGAAGSGGGAA